MQLRSRLSFQGRFSRKQFWPNWLGAILLLGLSVLFAALLGRTGPVGAFAGGVLALAGFVMAVWVSLATQVKRWHDLNRSGWMVLLNFVPVLGFFICVISLGFVKGKPGRNRFDPKDPALVDPPAPASAAVPAPAAALVDAPAIPPVIGSVEPPLVTAPAPPRAPSKVPRFVLAAVLGLLGVMVLGAACFFFISPHADWAVRRSWLKARLGSPAECQAMAWRYRAGRGVPQDFAQAAVWFERAANKGLAPAQYDLAVLHFYGLGVPADPAKARPLLEAAVQQNYVPAMTLLGMIQEADDPGSAAAIALWEQAAAAGDPWAESLLGSARLAQRGQGDGKENLILGLYWLESARRHGVETVGGLLQHVWATVAAEDLETVTGEVFGRLENGKPDPLPHEVAAPVEPAAPSETPTPTEPPAEAPAEVALGDEVLAQVRTLPEYTTVSTQYAEKSQADSSWPASEEGQAVGQYLQTMRTDAQSAAVKKGDDGKLILEYTVGGQAVSDTGVRGADVTTDPEYRRSIVEALAQNIVAAPRPLKVTEFLKQSGGDAK